MQRRRHSRGRRDRQVPDRGDVDALVDRSPVRGPISEVAVDHLSRLPHLSRKARGGEIDITRDIPEVHQAARLQATACQLSQGRARTARGSTPSASEWPWARIC